METSAIDRRPVPRRTRPSPDRPHRRTSEKHGTAHLQNSAWQRSKRANWTAWACGVSIGLVALHALVGRDAELRDLLTLLDGTKEGGGGALVLYGEAGIGKSALLGAATAEATARDARVLSVTGVPAEG